MKKMMIYEPAMCCSTGLCGVGVDPELLRISTLLSTLQKNGVVVGRYNLTDAPQEFINSAVVNQLITEKGVEILPVVTVDGQVVMTNRYPTNEEFITLLGIDASLLKEQPKQGFTRVKANVKSGGCCSDKGGCC